MSKSAYTFCETLAATGAWHIRSLTGPFKKMEGAAFGEDRRTLCGLRAAWDIKCEITPAALDFPRDQPGHTCATCKEKYLELISEV